MQQSKKEERVHQVFESISDKYDFMNSVISFQMHKAWRRDTMKRMGVRQGATALDVCCGTADWTIALARAVGPDGKVYGLDFSRNMLKVGRDKVDTAGLTQVELIHGNAMSLPYSDNSFDHVTIGFGLRNVPDYLQVLREMCRVAKPGGQVVCLETSQPTVPVFKQFYYAYFKYVMPLLGKLFAQSYNQYSWLQESARDFPDRKQLIEMFHQAGLVNIKAKPYSSGVAAMHLGYKPES